MDVKSQISGIFYRTPVPDTPPFVEVGSEVRKGQTLALLEAMKLFSKVKAPISGVVAEICADQNETVSAGQVLLRIEPSST